MENKGLVIERIFDAPVESVWKAWTTPDLVKKWWGPEGFYAPSVKIDFRVGGKYIYAMHGPKGSEWDKDMYSAGVFKEIIPNKKLVITDYFSDELGNKLPPSTYGQANDFPDEQEVTVLFEELGVGKSMLSIIYPKPTTKEQLDAILKSGMQEGWNSSLDKLGTVVPR
jgi:uncharacterized protein YndB with AHSA1/START domain